MTTPSRNVKRPGRSPGATNLGIALAVLAVLVPLLLQASTGAPPTAAEFAPNAKQVIKNAPPGQAVSATGTGANATPSASPSASASAAPTAAATKAPPTLQIPENELKQCVGPPPLRQTEDPQSPPCIAYYLGKNNGGATWRGVTKQAVYIAIPTPDNTTNQFKALQAFFNKRFEFYGRKLVFEFCDSSGGGSGSAGESDQNADAAMAAHGCAGGPPPFASTFYRTNNGRYYNQTMGCRYKTIAVGSYSPFDSTYLNRCPGMLYQYPMDVDTQLANFGEWACDRLAGKNATHAQGKDNRTPPKDLKSQRRKFGIFLAPFVSDDPVATRKALNPLTTRLHACGSDVAEQDIIINPVAGEFDPATAQNSVLQLKSHHVSSIFCMCNFFSYGSLAKAATASNYHPEWLTGTFGLNDVNSSFLLSTAPSDQLANTFGLTFQPRQINPLLQPYNQALQEGDPSQSPETATTVEGHLEVYRALLVIASGVQMAGPNLTPTTFRNGLRKAAFPNPQTAIRAGNVDVKADGYSMTSDGAEWWWSSSKSGPFTDSSAHAGTVCYVNGGQRHVLGNWIKGGDPFFVSACDSG